MGALTKLWQPWLRLTGCGCATTHEQRAGKSVAAALLAGAEVAAGFSVAPRAEPVGSGEMSQSGSEE